MPNSDRKSAFLQSLAEVAGPDADRGEGYFERLDAVAVAARRSGGFDPGGDATVRAARVIAELTAWLACHSAAQPTDILKWLARLLEEHDFGEVSAKRVFATIVSVGDWQDLLALLEDRLLLTLVEASVGAHANDTAIVPPGAAAALSTAMAQLRVALLVDELATGQLALTRAVIDDRLTCPVNLPSPPFPLLSSAKTAGPPVIADLHVVRDEWSRYIAGEVAFIENVMPGEERERSMRTTNRTESVVEEETIDVSRSREETYESERTTEADESSRQTSLEIGLQFNNDLTVKYGAVENNTQIGASLAFSRTDAQRRATEIARESGRRTVEETERRIRQLRRETRETTVRELDAHRLTNTADVAVRGTYRWVEKIQRYQIFTYPHRLQLEFFLPEPGKFLRELLEKRAVTSDALPVPDTLYLTEDGKENGNSVTPDSITRDNYRAIGAALGTPDLPPPPEREIVVTESLSISGGTRDKEIDNYEGLPFPPVASGTKDVQLPEGYMATSWSASAAAAPELAKWKDHTDNSDDGVDEKIGYHSIVAAVTVGASNVLIRNRVMLNLPAPLPDVQLFNTVHVGPTDYRDRWLAENASWRDKAGVVAFETPFDQPLVGKLSFGATLGGSYNGTVSVTLRCVPSEEAMAAWRTDIYSTFSGAVDARTAQIASAETVNRAENADTVRRSISPTVRRPMIRAELKRQVIECLLGIHFSGFDDAPVGTDVNGVSRPLQKFDQALNHAVLIRFFEQSFEWDNLMHLLYPAYWASSTNWRRMVDFDSTDLELTEFLEAGGARVLAPARPGFEPAVYTFLELGLIVPGSVVIGGNQTPSLSVAQEIMALTRPPEDGVPGDAWEATVPTALLWLDTELALPIKNPEPDLDEPNPGAEQ
ncbi:hypothetical protein [Streptomyces phaeochromogenes]|uniref:hypothetical protein n=1 Tax=Streptomyces phaeochromogenes TaxID=1923 RepID=UPI003867A2BE|nr:hypothetical protein OG277_41815 [Streptomyces phaeochromogenes]